jgi:hypothetical protein
MAATLAVDDGRRQDGQREHQHPGQRDPRFGVDAHLREHQACDPIAQNRPGIDLRELRRQRPRPHLDHEVRQHQQERAHGGEENPLHQEIAARPGRQRRPTRFASGAVRP